MIVDSPKILSNSVQRSRIRYLHVFQEDFLPEVIEISMIRSRVKRMLFLELWLDCEFVCRNRRIKS